MAMRLMIQGTASNAGKSMMVTALCRIFTRRGLKVAPFKSQNMSLNSCVCHDGVEMARAQMLQAMACQRRPEPEMNPILLKPDGPGRSQVILFGENQGSMSVGEYHSKYQDFFNHALQAYEILSKQVDLVIMEGAGSISEINLRSVDLVNMPFAEATQTPTLLVGNIDLGGVYAALVGSIELLTETERKLVKGFLINRFHGEAELLKPAHEEVTARTGKPFFGVIPHLNHLRLPEEDSVSFSNPNWGKLNRGPCIDIVVIDVGYTSNINDFEPLLLEEDVQLRKVTQVSDLGQPDVIILPGSKNVFLGMQQLQQRGFIEALREINFLECVGICGGLIMLSEEISDPHAVESPGGDAIEGCSLIPMKIRLESDKVLKKKTITWDAVECSTEIYEMHHGKAHSIQASPIAYDEESQSVAWQSQQDTRVWGTWCHGIFDDDSYRRFWINRLRIKKGYTELKQGKQYGLSDEINRLADHIEVHSDIEKIFQIIQKGV
jgi:cobyric acid synthase CobQ